MGELKVSWSQTETQAKVEQEYRALAQVQDYLDRLSDHAERLSELEELHVLLKDHPIVDIAQALAQFKDKPELHALSYIVNNPKYLARVERKGERRKS